MPSPEVHITPGPAIAIQYTGSNSGDILTQVPDLVLVSEVGNFLTVDHFGSRLTLGLNHWIAWNPYQTLVLSETQYANEWGCYSPCDAVEAIAALTARVEALENSSPLLR